MIVNGVEIPANVVKAMEEKILSGSFTFSSLMWLCYGMLTDQHGWPADMAHHISDRGADRLLQWYRKQGRVQFGTGGWSLVS